MSHNCSYFSFVFLLFIQFWYLSNHKNKNIVLTPYLHTCEFVLCNHLKIDISTATYCSLLNSNSNKSIHSTLDIISYPSIVMLKQCLRTLWWCSSCIEPPRVTELENCGTGNSARFSSNWWPPAHNRVWKNQLGVFPIASVYYLK